MGSDSSELEVRVVLQELRRSIDVLDTALVSILIERFRLTERVGQLKADSGLHASDPIREQEQLRRHRAQAEAHGADPEVIGSLMVTLMNLVKARHREIHHELTYSEPADSDTETP